MQSHPSALVNRWLFGTIRSVEPAREMLYLHRPKDGSELAINCLPDTHVLCSGEEIGRDALQAGQQIAVQFASDAGQGFAVEINIVTREPSPGEFTNGRRRTRRPDRANKKLQR